MTPPASNQNAKVVPLHPHGEGAEQATTTAHPLTAPDIIYIDARVRGLPITQRVLAHLDGVQNELIRDLKILAAPAQLRQAKRQWLLTQAPKKWCEVVEASAGMNVLQADFVTNRPYDLSYDGHPIRMARSPFLSIVTNVEECLSDLGRRCAAAPAEQFRLRCGELGDPLALDPLCPLNDALIAFFGCTPNATLELVTRTVAIDHLLELPHRGRTIIVMPLLPQTLIDQEEWGTAALAERLAAARKLREHGYRVAYSLDPILQYAGWERDYDMLLDALFDATAPAEVERVELSCFAHPRNLANKALERFPQTRIYFGELIPTSGTYRYVRPLRQQMYRYLHQSIRRRATEVPVQIIRDPGVILD